MNLDWQNEPATEKQKERLRFFGCTWDEGITAGQAADALKECERQFPEKAAASRNLPTTTEDIASVFVPPTPEQFAQIRSFGKTPPKGLTYEEAKIWIEQCKILCRPKPQSQNTQPLATQAAGFDGTDHGFPPEPKRSDPKYQAWTSPEGQEYGFARDHLCWKQTVQQIKDRVQAEKSIHQQKDREEKETQSYYAESHRQAAELAKSPEASTREQSDTLSRQVTIQEAERNARANSSNLESSKLGEPVPPRGHCMVHDYAPNGFCRKCGWAMPFSDRNQRASQAAQEGIPKGRGTMISSPNTNSLDRSRAASEMQKVKLRFFGCTWDEGITEQQATDAIENLVRLFPKLADAYHHQPATLEQLDELCGSSGWQIGLSYGGAQELKAKEQSRYGGPFYVNPRDNFVQQSGSVAKICYPTDAAKQLDALLSDLILTGGNRQLPVANAAKLIGITGETKLGISQCRQIAGKIESIGYCIEPDARFGGGSYGWYETVGLFKRIAGDRVKPSTAFLGAANLLRLCVLIAVADGRIDEAELDVFRQVIESQLDFSQTDHQRLHVLEQLLAQDPSSAGKTLAKVAKSVPAHKRLMVGKVLVRVSAADTVITKEERRALERIFKSLGISSDTLEKLIMEQVPTLKEYPRENIQALRVREYLEAQRVNGEIILKAWTDANAFVRTGHVLVFSHAQHWWLIPANAYREFTDVKTAERIQRPPDRAILELHAILGAKAQAQRAEQEPRIQGSATPASNPQTSKRAAPCPLCGWSNCCCASGKRIPERVATALPQGSALDMSRVSVITDETREVVGILSVLMEDEPGDPEKPAVPTRSATVAVTEIAKISSEREATPQPTRFGGLDMAFHPVLERLLTRDAWSQADFNALAREFHFMPLNIRDTLNEWADEVLGDFVLEGEDPVVIRRQLITKEII